MRARSFLPIWDHAVPFTARPANVRFWVYNVRGWVRITLAVGQSCRWSRSWHNGEGRSWESVEYTYDGRGVERRYGHGGSDCDGRTATWGADYCDADRLACMPSYVETRPFIECFRWPRWPTWMVPIVLRPDWQPSEPTRCSDEYAERMGY